MADKKRRKKGDLPQSTRSAAEARGMWVCAVCYYTENKVGSSKCFICQARNPEARDSMVVSVIFYLNES